MIKIGFDHNKYTELQTGRIMERLESFGGKLYLEFGGKLFDDFHASRVLPGFQPDSKMKMLLTIKDQAEIVIAISASDIENNKRRGDLGITYDTDVLRLIDAFRDIGLYVGSVVLTKYQGQKSAAQFQQKLESLGIRVYRHYPIENYPSDVEHIVSPEGFGKNDYIETTRPVVVITAPGPGSGKMATCLSQLYHEHERGISAGYAKFETFPIWNLPLNHPVNLAYEAATADLSDDNMIAQYDWEAYHETTVNYNRDIEIFPVLEEIFKRISGTCRYKSPTDMGVNMIGYAISDDEVCREASKQEIIRRYLTAKSNKRKGVSDGRDIKKLEVLMSQLGLEPTMRPCVGPALKRAEETGGPATAIELPDGHIVTGKTTDLMGASSAALINGLKYLAGIQDDIVLLAPAVIEPIQHLKVNNLGSNNRLLHIDEVLITLAICAVFNPAADAALKQLDKMRGSEVHTTVILSNTDESTFKKLGFHVTMEPVYQTSKLYHK